MMTSITQMEMMLALVALTWPITMLLWKVDVLPEIGSRMKRSLLLPTPKKRIRQHSRKSYFKKSRNRNLKNMPKSQSKRRGRISLTPKKYMQSSLLKQKSKLNNKSSQKQRSPKRSFLKLLYHRFKKNHPNRFPPHFHLLSKSNRRKTQLTKQSSSKSKDT